MRNSFIDTTFNGTKIYTNVPRGSVISSASRSAPEINPSDYEIQDLRDSLLTSEYFRSKENSRKILDYLFSRPPNRESASWKEIAGVLMDAQTFEKKYLATGDEHKVHSSVRTHMRNLRRELDQAFNVDRNLKCKRLAVTMRRGEYRLIFSHRIPDMVATFWRKHLERSASNLALITAPLFFRTPDYVYLRDIHCNENTASPSLLNRLGGSDAWPSLHYLSSGEVLAAIRLSETFQGNGATLQIRLVSSFPDLTICADQNLILIGSARTHPHIADFQVGLPVILTNDGVEIARDTGRPPYQFKDDSEANYALSRENVILDKYAVLTRFRKHDRTDSPVVTMIGANHGRAAQGVADIVTVSQDLYELAKQFGAAELPERFQAVIKVLVRREKGEAIIIGQSVVETMQY